MGTPIFKVSGNKKQQIEVFLTAEEYRYIQEKLPVQIRYQDQLLTGMIDAMSPVADRTNLFKATIQLSADLPLLGEIAKVSFPIQLPDQSLVPLERVKILNANAGSLQILSGGKTESYPVKIKKVWGAFVELEEPLPQNLRLLQQD